MSKVYYCMSRFPHLPYNFKIRASLTMNNMYANLEPPNVWPTVVGAQMNDWTVHHRGIGAHQINLGRFEMDK